jgi:hypothetical protein
MEESLEFEPIKKQTTDRAKTPRVDSLLKTFSNLNVKEGIRLQVADSYLLDLFDRSQKTVAATLAKVGDFEYYTPYQRIGSFIDFTQKLTWSNLKNIETYFYYTQNQINVVRYTKSSILKETNKSPDYLNNPYSLFNGKMKDEPEFNHEYDPLKFIKTNFQPHLYNPANWPKEFFKNIQTSLSNYNKYLNSDKILLSDIEPYNGRLNKSYIKTIDLDMLKKHRKMVTDLFKEIEIEYYITMKHAIMEYILLSPYERKRLNIQYLPSKAPLTSHAIAEHGALNRMVHTRLVEGYKNAQNYLIGSLYMCSIIASSVLDWTQCFDHINLYYLHTIGERTYKDQTLHMDDFYQIQESYLNKCFNFLDHIYYRGVLLITKKNKVLRQDTVKDCRWTFRGLINKRTFEEGESVNSSYETEVVKSQNNYENLLYGMDYGDQLTNFWSEINFDKLVDIRLNPVYYAYMTLLKKTHIDFNKYEYDEYTNKTKLKLNNSVSTYVSIFFRQIVEKSVKQFADFLLSFRLNDTILKSMGNGTYNINSEIHYNEKEVKLPNLLSFQILENTLPIINIKCKYDQIYNLVRLEYSHDEVLERILSLFDQCITMFNNLYTTHFLDFKLNSLTELEKIQKTHWFRLNEIFLNTKILSFPDDYFANVCPNIIVEPVLAENNIQTTLRIGEKNEQLFMDIKSKIARHINAHYFEIEECLKLFEPLKELINNQLLEFINAFLALGYGDNNRYTNFLDKIKTHQRYIVTLPKFVSITFNARFIIRCSQLTLGRLNKT